MRPCHTFVLFGSNILSNLHYVTSQEWTVSNNRRDAFIGTSTRRHRSRQRLAPVQYLHLHETHGYHSAHNSLHAESSSSRQQPLESSRKKKNKYAQFSKSDTLDPMAAMLLESRGKLKELSKKQSKRDKKAAVVDESLEAVEELLSSFEGTRYLDEVELQGKRQWERNKRQFPDNKSIDPYDPTTYGYIELGTILGPHGVHGALKLSSITDFPQQRLCQSGVRHLKPPNKRAPRQITLIEGRLFQSSSGNSDNPIYLIQLEGIEGREDAAKLKGCVLYCLEEEKVDDYLEQDEYIVSDLVGLNVFLSEDAGDAIGKGFEDLFVGFIDGVVLGSEMCAIPGLGQDMLEVALPSDQGGQGDDRVLIPFVPQIVINVDLEGRMVTIDPPKGLLELSYRREVKVKLKGLLPEASSYQLK